MKCEKELSNQKESNLNDTESSNNIEETIEKETMEFKPIYQVILIVFI